MPLIILTGIPSSGKSKRTEELKKYFETEHGQEVEVISEIEMVVRAGYNRDSFYAGK